MKQIILALVFQANVMFLYFKIRYILTYDKAVVAEKGEVELMQSLISGFVFNNSFKPDIMNYDVHYQNEQSNSVFFQKHLLYVLQLLK